MERNFKILVLSSLIALNFSCKKNSPVEPPLTQPPKLASGLYAVGTLTDTNTGSKGKAAIWKNGVMSLLSTGLSGAGDIAIKDTNIYVSGYVNEGAVDIACYWVNGVLNKLPGSAAYGAQATDIAVKGNDVYVVGSLVNGFYSGNEPVYWKNGVMTKLNANGKEAWTSGIILAGDDVYICGGYSAGFQKDAACYWKNGVLNILPSNAYASNTTELAVANNDLYIIGFVWGAPNAVSPPFVPEAVYWKNGELTKLTSTQPNPVPGHIVVQGTDIYIGGQGGTGVNYTAMYWKNGVNTLIPDSFYGTSIAVQGNDVYIGGFSKRTIAIDQFGIYGGVWKNGTPILSASAASQIYDITLVP